jgi:hypothetical protein
LAFTGAWLFLGAWLFSNLGFDLQYAPAWLIQVKSYWYAFWLLIAASGFIAGYVRNFPSWSYAYAGLFFLISLFIGWSFSDRVDIWLGDFFPPGMRAMLLPLICLIPLVICLAITRSLRPLGRFFTNLDGDASQLSFAFFAGWPVLLWLVYADEHSLKIAWFILLQSALLVLGAFFYLRSATVWRRTAALAGATIGSMSIFVVGAGPDPVNISGTLSSGAIISMIILLPALLGSAYALLEPSKRSIAGGMGAGRRMDAGQ